LGYSINLNFGINVPNLDFDICSLMSKLVFGKSKFNRILLKSKSVFVVGNGLQNVPCSVSWLTRCLTRVSSEINTSKYKGRFFFFKLYNDISPSTFSEIGISNKFRSSVYSDCNNRKGKSLIAVLAEGNVAYNTNEFDFVVSIGCHGSSRFLKSDLILPSSHPFEYKSSYINNFGYLDNSRIYPLKSFMESRPVYSTFNLFAFDMKGGRYLLAFRTKRRVNLIIFRQAFFVSVWNISSFKCLNIFQYFRNYIVYGDYINMFSKQDITFPVRFDPQQMKSLSHDILPSFLYGVLNLKSPLLNFGIYYNLENSFVRASLNLNLAAKRFKGHMIYK
jgi:hypothetical protein